MHEVDSQIPELPARLHAWCFQVRSKTLHGCGQRAQLTQTFTQGLPHTHTSHTLGPELHGWEGLGGTAHRHTQNHTRSVQSAAWRRAGDASQNIRVSTEGALPQMKVYEPQEKGSQPSPPSLSISYTCTHTHTHTHTHLKAKGSELKPSPHLPPLSSPGHQTRTPLSALSPQVVSLSVFI